MSRSHFLSLPVPVVLLDPIDGQDLEETACLAVHRQLYANFGRVDASKNRQDQMKSEVLPPDAFDTWDLLYRGDPTNNH